MYSANICTYFLFQFLNEWPHQFFIKINRTAQGPSGSMLTYSYKYLENEINFGISKAVSVFLPSRSGHCQRKLKHTTCGFVVWCRIINKLLLQFIGTNILAWNQPVRGPYTGKLTNKTLANLQ